MNRTSRLATEMVRLRLDCLPKRLRSLPLTPSFLDSVRRLGVMKPIVLVRVGTSYRVIDGKRRILASRATGRTDIPAKIFNEVQADHPLAACKAVANLLEDGLSVEQIHEATGIAPKKVQALLQLADDLLPPLHKAVGAGKLRLSVALVAAKLPTLAQRRLVKLLERTGRVTAKDVHHLRERCRLRMNRLPLKVFQDGWQMTAYDSLRHLRAELSSRAPRRFLRILENAMNLVQHDKL